MILQGNPSLEMWSHINHTLFACPMGGVLSELPSISRVSTVPRIKPCMAPLHVALLTVQKEQIQKWNHVSTSCGHLGRDLSISLIIHFLAFAQFVGSKISLSSKLTTVTDENKEMKVCIGINSKYITDRTLSLSDNMGLRMDLCMKKREHSSWVTAWIPPKPPSYFEIPFGGCANSM